MVLVLKGVVNFSKWHCHGRGVKDNQFVENVTTSNPDILYIYVLVSKEIIIIIDKNNMNCVCTVLSTGMIFDTSPENLHALIRAYQWQWFRVRVPKP